MPKQSKDAKSSRHTTDDKKKFYDEKNCGKQKKRTQIVLPLRKEHIKNTNYHVTGKVNLNYKFYLTNFQT